VPQTLFFALREDLLAVFDAVESQGPLQYVPFGGFASPSVPRYSCGEEIPTLGRATCESAIASDTFLVTESGIAIDIRHGKSNDTDRYFVDQLFNPDTITFSSGGMWKEILLYGRVASASDSVLSRRLLRRFQSAIKKRFVRIGAYYVGPSAVHMLKLGKRLTIAEQSPPEFDLKLS